MEFVTLENVHESFRMCQDNRQIIQQTVTGASLQRCRIKLHPQRTRIPAICQQAFVW